IASLQSEGLRESTDYCDTCRFKFPINSEYLYTVGPPEMVVAFFTEFVFQRVTPKQISLNTDANVQIALITEETSIPSATLAQMLEEAPLNNAGDGKIIYVPIGLETAKKYRKGLLKLHQYQAKTRSIQWPSPRDIDGLWTTIKEYGHHLVYNQVLMNSDRAAHCMIRDSYKPGQLLKMLKSLWLSNSKTSLRELLSISFSTKCFCVMKIYGT
ncbi:hypothetical protein, partial, partial [Parasitella parasitica]